MGIYGERPWLHLYAEGQPHDITPDFSDALAMYRAGAARNPDGDALRYFDGHLTYRELDALTDAFAAGLLDGGLARGDRVALYLQNVPQFIIGLVGTWKAGGVAVSINPMNRGRELSLLLRDSGATVLVCLEGLYRDVAAAVVGETDVRTVITTSELEYQIRNDPRSFSGSERIALDGTVDMAGMLERFGGRTPPPVSFEAGDTAFLTYTSGTRARPRAR